MTLPNPAVFGLPQNTFTLGLGLSRTIDRIIKPASANHWNMAISYPFGYAENDFLNMFKGKTLEHNPADNHYIINGDPTKYYIHEQGGVHLVTPTNNTWYRPGNNGELTSVLPYFLETTPGYYESHIFFQYLDNRDGAPLEMPAYSLQWAILQDAVPGGGYEQYNSQKVTRSNTVWIDPLSIRLGVQVKPILTTGKPVWAANTVKIRQDLPAKLQLTISTGHDLTVWQYVIEIQ